MIPKFYKINNPIPFFSILPKEWQNLIVPYWSIFKNSAAIYVLKENNNIVAGGIVFSKNHPHKNEFEISNDYLYKLSYFYIGYVWVIPSKRNQQLASKWLLSLKTKHPKQKYWLTIEEYSLATFYKKNGFELLKESSNPFLKEWLLTYIP